MSFKVSSGMNAVLSDRPLTNTVDRDGTRITCVDRKPIYLSSTLELPLGIKEKELYVPTIGIRPTDRASLDLYRVEFHVQFKSRLKNSCYANGICRGNVARSILWHHTKVTKFKVHSLQEITDRLCLLSVSIPVFFIRSFRGNWPSDRLDERVGCPAVHSTKLGSNHRHYLTRKQSGLPNNDAWN